MNFPPFRTSGVVPAGGTLTLTFTPRESRPRRVTQVTNELTGDNGGSSCALRINGSLVTPLVPAGDAATGDPAVWVGAGDQLQVVWTGATVGAVGAMVVLSDDGSSA